MNTSAMQKNEPNWKGKTKYREKREELRKNGGKL